MILSEGRKRSVSSELEDDSAFCLRFPMVSSSLYVIFDKRNSVYRWLAVEQLPTADTCFARAAEFDRYTVENVWRTY